MKKGLLAINKVFTYFLSVLLIFLSFLVYLMFVVPKVLWLGNMSGSNFNDNFGSGLVNFFDFNYITFFLMPFLPILGAMLLSSLFVWIFYRHDKQAGKAGFINTVLTVLLAFVIFYLPMKASLMDHDIRYLRQQQIDEIYTDNMIKVTPRLDKEVQKIYQSLYYEGILEWRENPVAVADYELEKGDLKSLSMGAFDKLTLIATSSDEDTGFSQATVLLENKKISAEIYLASYWDSDGQVWTVRGYKEIEQNKYDNKDLGVSFPYLEDFSIEEIDPQSHITLTPLNLDERNQHPEGRIFSSLRIEKISHEEYKRLLNDFEQKANDKEMYPIYSQHDILVDEKPAVLIKISDPFSGGIGNNIYVENQDNIINIFYFSDTPFKKIYKDIVDDIILY
ncbi:MAG: hypothetical protein ABH830_02375 [Patescibacteria group bacterium]